MSVIYKSKIIQPFKKAYDMIKTAGYWQLLPEDGALYRNTSEILV